MFATLIPLFDDKMQVSAYSVVAQKKNLFVNTELATTGRLDGAAEIRNPRFSLRLIRFRSLRISILSAMSPMSALF